MDALEPVLAPKLTPSPTVIVDAPSVTVVLSHALPAIVSEPVSVTLTVPVLVISAVSALVLMFMLPVPESIVTVPLALSVELPLAVTLAPSAVIYILAADTLPVAEESATVIAPSALKTISPDTVKFSLMVILSLAEVPFKASNVKPKLPLAVVDSDEAADKVVLCVDNIRLVTSNDAPSLMVMPSGFTSITVELAPSVLSEPVIVDAAPPVTLLSNVKSSSPKICKVFPLPILKESQDKTALELSPKLSRLVVELVFS